MTKIIASALSVSILVTSLFATEPTELQTAKAGFQNLSHPSEAARQRYILVLVALRRKFADADRTEDWQAVDAEIRRHPMPEDSDSIALSKVLVGKWASPRHEYVFRSDGTWSMLPDEPDTTHGRWRIEGNQYFDIAAVDPPRPTRYTMILLNPDHFIFTDGTAVFYETRIKK